LVHDKNERYCLLPWCGPGIKERKTIEPFTGPGVFLLATLLMKDELLQKIEAELVQPITSERQVVYILVEIRKLLDRENVPKADCSHLRMLCNWAVHIELDRDIVEEHLLLLESVADQLRHHQMTKQDFERTSKVFDLFGARVEFLNLLRKTGLSRSLPDVFGALWWATFLRHYVGIVADCPLVMRARRTRGAQQNAVAKKIKSAAVKGYQIIEPSPVEQHLEMSLHLHWEIEFSDGFRAPWVMPLAIEKDRQFFGRADRI
jgi:hypothetical protein